MVSKEELAKYQNWAEKYLKDFGRLKFNHFGIKAKDSNAYQALKSEIGNILSEVNFRDRLVATAKKNGVILEILEPKPGDIVEETIIEHIGYVSENFDELSAKIGDAAISRFDVGSTHGFKVNPEPGLFIEIRNNDILDSVKDFE